LPTVADSVLIGFGLALFLVMEKSSVINVEKRGHAVWVG